MNITSHTSITKAAGVATLSRRRDCVVGIAGMAAADVVEMSLVEMGLNETT